MPDDEDHLINVAVLGVVRQLKPEQQECLELRYLQGLTVAETAQTMGTSQKAVKATQSQALRRLSGLLPDDLFEGDGAPPLTDRLRLAMEATALLIVADSEFRVGLRAMLIATGERGGIGRTSADPYVAGATKPAKRGLLALIGDENRRIRARGAIIIGIAAGAMAVSGIAAGSENLSPGDALYGG